MRERGDTVPVVVVTADARADLAEQMTQAGAQAVVTKPFDFDEMVEVLDQNVRVPA
jgi:CheY-like chemotaxis protein